MNTRIWLRTIANMDTRMCFTDLVTTGRVLGQDRANRADQRHLGKSLLYLLEVLAERERKDRVAESAQACADQASLLSTADEYARLVNSVRLSRRVLISDLARREMRRCVALNKCTNGTVLKARSQLTASDFRVRYRKTHCNNVCGMTDMDAKQEFDHVSRLVKTELERFEQDRIVDFKKNLEQLLDGVMTRQKESIQAREALQ
ncbi:hypothetical protein EDB85DRAFT_2272352 [Lactarius pseudohatsudake]|nr:hypothetical protein EDB85DRAFT_2272352 [Lactarius pseudohatsudake]